MKATTLINRLQNLVAAHGDLDVFVQVDDLERHDVESIVRLQESIDFAESDGD